MIDTTSAHSKLIIAVLGALAEFERSMILARTADGRARAMTRGVQFGSKPKLSQFQIAEALRCRAEGEPMGDIGRSYGVGLRESRWGILEEATAYRIQQSAD